MNPETTPPAGQKRERAQFELACWMVQHEFGLVGDADLVAWALYHCQARQPLASEPALLALTAIDLQSAGVQSRVRQARERLADEVLSALDEENPWRERAARTALEDLAADFLNGPDGDAGRDPMSWPPFNAMVDLVFHCSGFFGRSPWLQPLAGVMNATTTSQARPHLARALRRLLDAREAAPGITRNADA